MKRIQLVRSFVVFVDTSSSLRTPQIRPLTQLLRHIFQAVLEQTPQSRLAVGVLQQCKAFVETQFTQDIEELISPFEVDRVTQSGSLSIASGLKVLSLMNMKNATCLLLNFSNISFDSENVFELCQDLQEKGMVFHTCSIGSDIHLLEELSQKLHGVHSVYGSLDEVFKDWRTFIKPIQSQAIIHNQEPVYTATLAMKQSLPVPKISNCCGILKKNFYTCSFCSAMNCTLGPCSECGCLLVTEQNIRKSQLSAIGNRFAVSEIANILEDHTPQIVKMEHVQAAGQSPLCAGCFSQKATVACVNCSAPYCADCAAIANDLGMCIHCQSDIDNCSLARAGPSFLRPTEFLRVGLLDVYRSHCVAELVSVILEALQIGYEFVRDLLELQILVCNHSG